MTAPASRPRLAVRVLFGAIVVGGPLLVLAAGEAWVRATREPLDLAALTGRAPAPHIMARGHQVAAFEAYRGRAGAYGIKTVNSHGFISTPEIAVARDSGTVRVVFLGGSSTAGTGKIFLPDSVTWPTQVAALLRRRHPGLRLEYINAALAGYTSFESYGRLWSRLRFYRPDVLVVMHGWNEMYYFTAGAMDSIAFWRTRPDGSWSFDPLPVRRPEYAPRWFDPLLVRSQLLTRLRIRFTAPVDGEWDARAARPAVLADHYDRRGLEVWRANLRLIQGAARAMDAELFVIRQPTLIVPGLAEAERARADYYLHGFDHDAHVDAFRGIYRVIEDEIPADRIIALDSLSGRPDLFADHVHPTPEGSRVFAEAVTAAIERVVMARAARR